MYVYTKLASSQLLSSEEIVLWANRSVQRWTTPPMLLKPSFVVQCGSNLVPFIVAQVRRVSFTLRRWSTLIDNAPEFNVQD